MHPALYLAIAKLLETATLFNCGTCDTNAGENNLNGESNEVEQSGEEHTNEFRACGRTGGTYGRHRRQEQTAKLPSDLFLWAAVRSIGGSLVFKMSGKDHHALFVEQWAPMFLILGLYNKLVKLRF